MNLSFDSKTALITGASRGIGKAISKAFAASGVKVVCVSKSNACEDLAQEINQSGGTAFAYPVDVSNREAVAKACETILADHHCIDILINNAGITRDGLLLKMSYQDWDDVIGTNLSSMFYWIKGLLPPMVKKRDGRIINISSVVGIMGNPGQFNYCAAKGGMLTATKSAAKELAGRNITVNAVAPGFIKTDMTEKLNDEVAENIKKMIPLKRMGEPEDIANAVLFLASEQAKYITGQVFAIDGGMTM